jgi:hypothetical protein
MEEKLDIRTLSRHGGFFFFTELIQFLGGEGGGKGVWEGDG